MNNIDVDLAPYFHNSSYARTPIYNKKEKRNTYFIKKRGV